MLYPKFTLLIALFFMVSISMNAQMNTLFNVLNIDTDYTDCAAILYNGDVLVDEYSPRGKCILKVPAQGKLSLSSVELTGIAAIPRHKIKFQVAIKNLKTNTLFLLTKEAVLEINATDILKQCKRGDIIVFLTTNKFYNLTHHEIEIMWGC